MREQSYISNIKSLKTPTFQRIRNIAKASISDLSQENRNALHDDLNHGIKLLNTHEQMCQYLCSFGNMHEKKIHYVVEKLPKELFDSEYNIIDWGCGQGLATICFFDYLKEKGFKNKVDKVKLIEPSGKALDRAKLHVSTYINDDKIETINKHFKDVQVDEIKTGGKPTIHFFSNILDIQEIDLKELATKIDNSLSTDTYLVTVGPTNATNSRIDWFYKYFTNATLFLDEENRFFPINQSNIKTLKAKVYKLEYNEQGNIIPVEFYPSVQFHAAYQLDIIKQKLKELSRKETTGYFKKLTAFEISAPFDIGANVYDDIHPVFAVLSNIITRGLPTKASIFIEEIFEKYYSFSKKTVEYGEIKFNPVIDINISEILNNKFEIHKINDKNKKIAELVYSPVLIARIQKTIIEALLTNKLELKKNWKILIEEKDVPAGKLALEDLEQLFNQLTSLTKEYKELEFPEIELTIVGNKTFQDSALHLKHNVLLNPDKAILEKEYDMVIDVSVFKSTNKNENFSKYRAKNNCYFNIRSSESIRNERNIYTTDRITYRSLVKYDSNGKITEHIQSKSILTYFLQLLFRKEDFRPGQLPILHRALKNKSVIGLLPTGGGKSLTYQLAALLQPGVTIIIDPLKSLMKDQYDGLINAGIDNCDYINSTLTRVRREKVEERLEKSRLLFIFLSPERLAIYKFRERLKNMQQLNVYFTYGVIDEVHCVSEWGHDFRFSYLHLGRNLYNYVKAKNGNISLFGLTATASFDVLADVERELSGNDAFVLDAETIVRHENTNRLELQYKIEKINVEFQTDKYYDKNNKLDNSLPKPVRIADKWSFYNQKKAFLKNNIKKITEYIKELQADEHLNIIKDKFIERINLQNEYEKQLIENAYLKVDMPSNYYSKKTTYQQAGIVFCPHKNKTGISVNSNVQSINDFVPDIGKFYGGDNNSGENRILI